MGPLHGLRVIEFAGIGPGPMCAMLLADMGADVVRIDRLEDSGLGVQLPPRFAVTSRNRRSACVDLKSEAGREALMRILESADVLIEGFRPGVMERLGLGPSACQARNPRLVYGRMTGFGQTGPLAHAAGHDLNYIALSGALHAIGPTGGDPVPPLNLVGDYGGGALYLALGIMAAVFERQSSGRGQVVDAAMVDGAASLMALFFGMKASRQWDGGRGENLLDGGAPFYGTYATADGHHVAVGPIEPKFFAELVTRLGMDPSWIPRQYDRAGWPALREALAQAIGARTREECRALLEGTDACFAPVLSMEEAPHHPHAQARQIFIEIDGVVQPAPAPRFDRSQAPPPRIAPKVGEHTDAVLQEAGLTPEEIAQLKRAKAVQ